MNPAVPRPVTNTYISRWKVDVEQFYTKSHYNMQKDQDHPLAKDMDQDHEQHHYTRTNEMMDMDQDLVL